MNRTSIEWTDYTTNPIRYRDPEGRSVHGCIKVSAGCANCYASAWSARGLTGERGGTFTAKRQATLTPFFDEEEARRILRSRATGKKVFVGDMTDVFGEWVPDALLDRMFAVFALRPDLTFRSQRRVQRRRVQRMAPAVLSHGPGGARSRSRGLPSNYESGGDDMGRPMTANGHHEELRCEVVSMDQELSAHDAYERRALEMAARDVAMAQEYIEEWRWSAGGSASATRAWNALENALQTIRDLQRRDVRENALHRARARQLQPYRWGTRPPMWGTR